MFLRNITKVLDSKIGNGMTDRKNKDKSPKKEREDHVDSSSDENSMMTDSFFESDEDASKQLESNTIVFKIKFNELSNVFEMVSKFCCEYKIRKTDEYSFLNYIIVTVETEKLSFEGSKIVNRIQREFDVNQMLF